MDKSFSSNLRSCIGYHAYWRSFKDSNGDGIGDLEGIRQQLSYLSQDLGVNTLYINPFNPSPWLDGGYDVIDYEDVDPIAGTLDSVQRLIHDAHAHGMRIIFDLVPNHSSHLSPWFQESASSVTSDKRDWYIWKKGRPEGEPPNNWLSVLNAGEKNSAWTFDEQTEEYYLHSFLPQQPDLNWRNPKVRARMYDAMRFWYRMGVDGLRLDSIFWLGKDPDFRDDPFNPDYKDGVGNPWNSLLHTQSMSHPDMYQYLEEMAEVTAEFPGRFLIPEAYTSDIFLLQKFYKHCKGFGAPFNFNLITRPFDTNVNIFLNSFQSILRPQDVPIYVLGNHDKPRVATRFGSEQRARLAAMLLLTLPGFPLIYYGDELGMKNVFVPSDKVQDPHGKERPELGRGRDGERTPMQWSDDEYAGFTQADPWLPIDDDYGTRNVKHQMADPTSTWRLYQMLIQLRKTSSEMTSPNFEVVDVGEKPIIAYIRPEKDKKVFVLLNLSKETQTLSLGSETAHTLLNTYLDRQESQIDLKDVHLRPEEGLVLRLSYE